MDSFIQVDKSEWEAFLEDLSQLERKYTLLLNKLDMDENRLDALKTSEKKAADAETLRQLSKSSEKGMGGDVKGGFLSRLKTKLEPLTGSSMGRSARPGMPGNPQGYAACSRCGFRLVRACRFCERCDADFGTTVCSCGRGLSSGDRFCDRCGREVGGGG